MDETRALVPAPGQVALGPAREDVEQWAARRRGELSRLALELRAAQLEAHRAEERAGVAAQGVGAFVPAVDALLAAGLDQLEADARAAAAEAAALVAAAAREARAALLGVGVDGSALAASSAAAPSAPVVRAPRSAQDLLAGILAKPEAGGSAGAVAAQGRPQQESQRHEDPPLPPPFAPPPPPPPFAPPPPPPPLAPPPPPRRAVILTDPRRAEGALPPPHQGHAPGGPAAPDAERAFAAFWADAPPERPRRFRLGRSVEGDGR